MSNRTPYTAAARKALQRARQLGKGLVRVELIVPEHCKQKLKDLAEELCKEHEAK